MTIATKNGSVIIKSGSVAQNCGCCVGWYCYCECPQCSACPRAYRPFMDIQVAFDSGCGHTINTSVTAQFISGPTNVLLPFGGSTAATTRAYHYFSQSGQFGNATYLKLSLAVRWVTSSTAQESAGYDFCSYSAVIEAGWAGSGAPLVSFPGLPPALPTLVGFVGKVSRQETEAGTGIAIGTVQCGVGQLSMPATLVASLPYGSPITSL